MNIVAVVGNGASITYNAGFALPELTQEILGQFSRQKVSLFKVERRLSQLARAARPTDVKGPLSFEELLGPFDRMADGIEAMRRLALYVPGGRRHRDDLKSAAKFGRRLHRRGVGTALQVVTELSHGQGSIAWGRGSALVTWLGDTVDSGGTVRLFTLNYDCLADSAALDLHTDPDSPLHLSDMADGRRRTRIRVLKTGRQRSVLAHPLREPDEEYIGGSSAMILYHLHGAINWVRDSDGRTWKIRSVEQLRRLQFWKQYARGNATVSPVVVLTDQKTPYVEKDPFAWGYRRLQSAIAAPDDPLDLVLIAGYGFRDEPLNRVLRRSLPETSCPIVIIGKTDDTNALEREVLSNLGVKGRTRVALGKRLHVLGDGLPDSLAAIVL